MQTGYRCAVVLRDLIAPYLLRRRKADVAAGLPAKTETVLFCRLTQVCVSAVVLRCCARIHLFLSKRSKTAPHQNIHPNKPNKTQQYPTKQEQRELYRAYLASTDVQDILQGARRALAGIDVLRKICNHPDLLERTARQADASYGDAARSGKLQVLDKVLAHWHQQGHK